MEVFDGSRHVSVRPSVVLKRTAFVQALHIATANGCKVSCALIQPSSGDELAVAACARSAGA